MERWEIIQAAVDEIVTLLGDGDTRVVRFRRNIDGDALSKLLQSVLADWSIGVNVSSRALWLAPMVVTPRLIAEIVARLRTCPEIAGLAGDALRRIRSPSTVPELLKILADRALPSESRAAAARATEWLFDKRIKDCLLEILRTQGEDNTVLVAVLAALGMSQLREHTTDAVDDVCRLLASDCPDVRGAALTTIGNIGAAQAALRVEALVNDDAMTSAGRRVGDNAARVLRLLRDRGRR